MNQLFRNNYSIEEINTIKCQLCDGNMLCDAFGKWCSADCINCELKFHFIKQSTGYRLTDIMWQDNRNKNERRFWKGSINNIIFWNMKPKMEFEIESFDKKTLLELNVYIKKCRNS